MKIVLASILLGLCKVGTRILNPEALLKFLERGIENYKPAKGETPGQLSVEITDTLAFGTVSAGVGLRAHTKPEDYIIAEHRGQVGLYLKRSLACPVEKLVVIVYTREAYCKDPQVDAIERDRVKDASHVVVAVLASAGPASPRTPFRFVAALAGENNDFAWLATKGHPGGGDTRCKCDLSYLNQVIGLRKEAKEVVEYDRQYCVVADEPVVIAEDQIAEAELTPVGTAVEEVVS